MVKAKKSRERPYQIFVSHATADKWLATTLCEKLELAGATTFRDDRDINGGDDIPERIRLEIKRSRELVVLLSPESINRPWVLLEVGAAWGWSKSIRIVPILCHVNVDPIPGMIKSKKAITLNECTTFFGDVATRVREYREKE